MLYPTAEWEGGTLRFDCVSAGESPRAAAAALALVYRNGRVAVSDIEGRGWCIPGGRIEEGESLEETVRRECYEEAGLSLDRPRVLGHFTWSGEAAGYSVVLYVARASAESELPPGFESRSMRWMTRDEVPAHYYRWNPLLSSVFALGWDQPEAATSPDDQVRSSSDLSDDCT